MQISALNTIIAAQQARNTAPQRLPANPPPVDAAKSAGPTAGFEPLAFKGASSAQDSVSAASAANPYSPSAPLGSQIDIRV